MELDRSCSGAVESETLSCSCGDSRPRPFGGLRLFLQDVNLLENLDGLPLPGASEACPT